jgi:hypothetical protein
MENKIWITWETQRRSIELAKALGCRLYVFDIPGRLRYFISTFKTLSVLLLKSPDYLFIQNPSMFLATIACIYGSFSNTKIIVDRHSTFRINKPQSGSLSVKIFMHLHFFTLRSADLTIVTNTYLADLVHKANGHSFVLPDKLPSFAPSCNLSLKGKINILLISSFGKDEPIDEVIEAATHLSKDFCIYITGNFRKKFTDSSLIPENVVLTGFISNQDFINHLFACDIAMALTKSEYCMLCGCYEAISAKKPLITSNKSVLKNYFYKASFVDNTAESITYAINTVATNLEIAKDDSIIMKNEIERKWSNNFTELSKAVEEISG